MSQSDSPCRFRSGAVGSVTGGNHPGRRWGFVEVVPLFAANTLNSSNPISPLGLHDNFLALQAVVERHG